VGSGPAGLFCALRLAEAGLDVTVMERGSRVRERMKDIQGLEEEGRLDCESNVLFGEGGAGAYSDGKLTSRTASPESRWFFQRLVDLGAPSSVLYEARSHIGTDRLVGIVTRLRERLEDMGARFFFNCRVDDLLVDGGTVLGVATADGQEHRFDHLVLATGHSARDTYAMLGRRGVAMEAKAQKMDKSKSVLMRIEDMSTSILAQEYARTILARVPKVSDGDVQKFFDANKAQFVQPAMVNAQHILVKLDRNAKPEEDKAALAKIDGIRKEIVAGADFGKTAEKYSDDPGSKSKGGSLGFFAKDRMVPEFSQAAFGLKKGELSQPVKSPFGDHLISRKFPK
jgi:hypothetical protein